MERPKTALYGLAAAYVGLCIGCILACLSYRDARALLLPVLILAAVAVAMALQGGAGGLIAAVTCLARAVRQRWWRRLT